MIQLRLLTEDAAAQRFAEVPTAPGGLQWETEAAEKRLAYLMASLRPILAECRQELARLRHLKSQADGKEGA